MAQFSRTWWGQKFIEAIEQFTDSGRLSRGRSYARNDKVKRFEIYDNFVTAMVRGSVNPYFGVYKEPLYTTTIEFDTISKAKWSAVVALMASRASLISRLLLNEIPETIEDTFLLLGLHLLPKNRSEIHTRCSCPDFSNPCKHIAGVYYLIAAELDHDPFLLFELRGLPREELKAELEKSPLGQALSTELSAQKREPQPTESYYTQPQTTPVSDLNLKAFWQGEKRLPQTIEQSAPSAVPAILVKKQGDFPSFWERDNSFIGAMEEFYQRVKAKNKDVL